MAGHRSLEPQKIAPPPSSPFFPPGLARHGRRLTTLAACLVEWSRSSYRLYGKKGGRRTLPNGGGHLSRLRFSSPRCFLFNVEAESAGGQARRSGENPTDSLGPRPSARSRGTGAADSGLLLPRAAGFLFLTATRRPPPPKKKTVSFDFLRFLGF